jgi:polygalacturonase
VTSEISAVGSYTFTFSDDKNDKYTDPTFAPLTVMVTRNAESKIPESYNRVYIEPGYHENDELEFTKGNTVYVIKKGYHNVCSIGMPSNSVLLIEQGAYIQATDRKQADGSYNTKTVLHADHCNNVKIISRGLIDCGQLQGGEVKYKHVINTAVSRNVTIQGLTIINSNTWTLCAYGAYNAEIKENLLLGYRTYSDGIMMSDCTKSVGSYNFVRTGDDAIEFKGTGWWEGEARRGKDCVYEYNDLWTDKGAGYCLTWESTCDMNGMVFRNNSVGFALPTWTSRNTALDCLLGTDADTKWSDITFENIEIYHVKSPNAINLQIQGNGAILENITFKDITVKTAKNGVYALRMHFSADGGKISGIKLQNVSFCGTKLTESKKNDPTLFKNEAGKYFDELDIS